MQPDIRPSPDAGRGERLREALGHVDGRADGDVEDGERPAETPVAHMQAERAQAI